jgi:hypothetical protein
MTERIIEGSNGVILPHPLHNILGENDQKESLWSSNVYFQKIISIITHIVNGARSYFVFSTSKFI